VRQRTGVRALVLALVVVLVAGCGQDGPPSGPTGSDGPAGSARLVDDTGRPDVPDGGGWVALVPADRIADLWEAAGADPGDDLTHASVPVTRDQVEAVGGLAQAVSETGDFELGLTGPVVVCRVPGEGEASSTRGCAEVELTADSRLQITWGEAGLRVVG
jgi:predicted small lipoprotein YifL